MDPAHTRFATTDLGLASYLAMMGQPYKMELDAKRAGRVHFVFEPQEEVEQEDVEVLVKRYRDGDARVEPLGYIRKVAEVRSKLYQLLNSSTTFPAE